jgi:large subunit ribosomal protein L24e
VVIITETSQVLAKKRNEKPEVRAAARDAALREIKARAAKKKGAKK